MKVKTNARFLSALLVSLCAGASLAAGPPEDPATEPLAIEQETRFMQNISAEAELNSSKITSNAIHEGETAVTALNIGGVDHTIAAYMRWDGTNLLWRVRTAKSTDLSTWLAKLPAIPTGHRESVDPVLDVNPKSAGVGPLSTYLGGLTYNTAAEDAPPIKKGDRLKPEAIVVWRSTDGGTSWSSPVKVEENVNNATYGLDKPDVGVSWYPGTTTIPSTRGWLFVAYVRGDATNQPHLSKIMVARSTNGGVSFGAPVQVVQGKVHAPQVFVSSATGRVYLIYADYQANALKMAISTDNGQTWPTTETVASGNLISPYGVGPGAFNLGTINGSGTCGVWAITIPMARYNHVKDAIGVVWHERETASTSSPTTVYFAAKTASGWQAKKNLTSGRAGDQWHPALDFDSLGNYIVAFPDRSQDSNNRYFRQAWIRTNHLGTALGSGYVANPFDSDPAIFQETLMRACFRGDYQDVWFWPYAAPLGGLFQVLWAGNPETSGALHDIYISSVQ